MDSTISYRFVLGAPETCYNFFRDSVGKCIVTTSRRKGRVFHGKIVKVTKKKLEVFLTWRDVKAIIKLKDIRTIDVSGSDTRIESTTVPGGEAHIVCTKCKLKTRIW